MWFIACFRKDIAKFVLWLKLRTWILWSSVVKMSVVFVVWERDWIDWWKLRRTEDVTWVDVLWGGSCSESYNPQDAINPERKTWPGRLRHNGQHLQHRLGTPQDGTCLSRRQGRTRSLEDARYIHINFRLLADLVVFEQVNAGSISVRFLLQESPLALWITVLQSPAANIYISHYYSRTPHSTHTVYFCSVWFSQ